MFEVPLEDGVTFLRNLRISQAYLSVRIHACYPAVYKLLLQSHGHICLLHSDLKRVNEA